MTAALLAIAAVLFVVLLYLGHGYWAWVSAAALALAAWWLAGIGVPAAFWAVTGLLAAAAALFGLRPVRRLVLSAPLMGAMRRVMPTMGDTERIALEAGTVWWDGDLFSGNPDWQKLLDFEPRPLSEAEQAFLHGPVEELCAMVDDWQIQQDRDLPPEVWAFLKKKRFFGMIIPEEYGGLGFSAIGHSAVIAKLSTRSITTSVTVMVPNSLGPAELLLHYGTDEQKNHYLPRLARGDDIPCFALTEPEAGSDAASPRSTGVVCRGQFDGEDVLGMRLNWRKRYITLAPVATVIGLAFRLLDPDGMGIHHLNRQRQARQPLKLVGPDKSPETALVAGVGEVNREHIASRPATRFMSSSEDWKSTCCRRASTTAAKLCSTATCTGR